MTQVWSPEMSATMPERAASSSAPRQGRTVWAVRYSSRAVGFGLLLETCSVLLMRAHVDLGACMMLGLFSLFGLLVLLLLPAKQTRDT